MEQQIASLIAALQRVHPIAAELENAEERLRLARKNLTTLTISLSGSAITGLTTNPSKTYTVSDSDLQLVLNWAAVAFAAQLPASPTNAQILLAWVQNWINGTKTAVQQFDTPPPTVPPQVSIT